LGRSVIPSPFCVEKFCVNYESQSVIVLRNYYISKEIIIPIVHYV